MGLLRMAGTKPLRGAAWTYGTPQLVILSDRAVPVAVPHGPRSHPFGLAPPAMVSACDVTLVALPHRNATVMNAALAQHDRLVRATMAACCGYEVSRRTTAPAVRAAWAPYRAAQGRGRGGLHAEHGAADAGPWRFRGLRAAWSGARRGPAALAKGAAVMHRHADVHARLATPRCSHHPPGCNGGRRLPGGLPRGGGCGAVVHDAAGGCMNVAWQECA